MAVSAEYPIRTPRHRSRPTGIVPSRPDDPAEPRIADHVIDTVPVFAASVTCVELDELFRSDSSIRCVAVRADDGTLGMIMHDRFIRVMTGPFGFGRALLARKPVGALADWNPLVLAPDIPVDHACQTLRQRQPANAYDDILVRYASGRIGRVSAASIFDSVARRCADQAGSDPLTALANRRLFLRRLDDACQRANAGESSVIVAFVDLDSMKQINDVRGHDVGDAVLIAVARGLRRAAPRSAIVARLGGDEFAVLVRAVTADQSVGRSIGECLRHAVADIDPGIATGIRVRASVGVAVSGGQINARTMLSAADQMMYQAKRSGGDRVSTTALGVAAHSEAQTNVGDAPSRVNSADSGWMAFQHITPTFAFPRAA